MIKLINLLKNIQYKCIQGNLNKKIVHVTCNSKNVKKNSMFICISGFMFDGHKFINNVLLNGAIVLVVERDITVSKNITIIKVNNTRYAMAYIYSQWFNKSSNNIITIGITGTNGKTTTSYFIKSILENSGYKVGLIGTIEIIIGNKIICSVNTTPDSYMLQKYIYEMIKIKCNIVIIEVSSQSLMLYRTNGIMFDFGIFTNITRDHIGVNEHKNFNNYIKCKSKFFRQCKIGIVNFDNKYYKNILNKHTCKIQTFGINKKSDFTAKNIRYINNNNILGTSYDIDGIKKINNIYINIPGKINVYNSLAAITVCSYFKFMIKDMKKNLKITKINGRMNIMYILNKFIIVIDFAHNAVSLKKLLITLKIYKHSRIICLFGCGGERSKLRRYEMGEVSGNLSDLTIITSDNPRNENPKNIINDIEIGINKTHGKYIKIINRKEAILYAINNGCIGDIIVLAGKGHENYQEINGIKYYMNDKKIVKDIINNKK